ncbi:CsbD family protein [Microvirga subterranea]|uniref:CsbD-like protein n=1 Tax=Microvirga subterranea TaxID=186651 RepID=A0A370HV19_9HYPH|nr:CsbD family protein [Microvirga subterranea]RDI62363.1 CsbD-like protein [Microvirga subterranea]
MDKDRAKGAATRMGGKMKQAAGDLTGDTKMQTEGKMDQAKGKAQNAMGSAKDALKK